MELMASKGVILELFLVKVAKLPLGPPEAEERASPHVPQCASAQRNVLKNVILSEGEVVSMVNLVKYDIVKIMIFHSS